MSFVNFILGCLLEKRVKLLPMLIFWGLLGDLKAQDLIDNIEDKSGLEFVLKPFKGLTDAMGDPILEVNNISDWKGAYRRQNPAMVFVDNQNHYFYNYPAFKKIFQTMDGGESLSKPYINDFKKFDFESENVSYKAIEITDDIYYFEDQTYFSFWVADEYEVSNESKNTVKYDLSRHHLDKSWYIELYAKDLKNGYQIMSKELKSGFQKYSAIMPLSNDLMLSEVTDILRRTVGFDTLLYKIHFNQDGENKSSVISSDKKISTVLESLKVPYFNGNPVPCLETFDLIKVASINKAQKGYRLNSEKGLKLKDALIDDLRIEWNDILNFQFEEKIETINVNGERYLQNKYISRVKSTGPEASLFSLWPGLGLSQVLRTKLSDDRSGPKTYEKLFTLSKILKITSSVALATAIGSKAISVDQYNKYRANVDGNLSSYNTANIMQKVFVTSSFLYGFLCAVDLTFTIPIGQKQKSIERKINSRIKSLYPIGLKI